MRCGRTANHRATSAESAGASSRSASRGGLRRLLFGCALVAVSTSLGGCRHKLLTPNECEYLAERLSGITAPDQLRNPRLRAEVEERTLRCLVTPYDRVFVRCLETEGKLDRCERELRERVRRR